MTSRKTKAVFGGTALAICLCLSSIFAAESSKPNVIVILADDLGRGDYSAFGTRDIRTPAIDRLCREGMTFENFRASSCVCSPTRAAFLTGCFPDRVGVPGVIRHIPNDSWGWLSPTATLLPQVLKKAGYHSALVGKWHLGLTSPNTPTERGFDSFRGFLGDMMDDYLTHLRGGQNFMRRDLTEIDPPGHATDLFTDWACEYLTERAAVNSQGDQSGRQQPFFLYLAYNAPHGPIQPGREWRERVRRREPDISPKRVGLVALIEQMDAGIEKVLGTLDRLNLSQNTLVFFTSDNGGVLHDDANNGPWRSEKQHMYDGGLRVPAVARWPGKIAAGTHTDRSAVTMDLFATIAEVAGANTPASIDAVSFLPVLLGEPEPEAITSGRELYFVRREGGLKYGGKTIEALIRGDWKLVQDTPIHPLELFHLKNDPLESRNVIRDHPEIAHELAAALRVHIQKGGQCPWQQPMP